MSDDDENASEKIKTLFFERIHHIVIVGSVGDVFCWCVTEGRDPVGEVVVEASERLDERVVQSSGGDLEIRVLKDGRFVLVAPDQELMDLGRTISEPTSEQTSDERNMHGAAHQEKPEPRDAQ